MWLPGRDPAEVAPEKLTGLVPPVRTFEGFAPEAFEALARLKAHPHIEQYRQEKSALRRYVQEPFRRLRDDLVVNWVLPSALALETERNVFSRFLKNDFGAGGCHAHYWMAFYRQGRRRLADVQLIVSLHFDGLRVGVYAGEPARAVWRAVRAHLPEAGVSVLESIIPLLQIKIYPRKGEACSIGGEDDLQRLSVLLRGAEGIWAGRSLSRTAVLRQGPEVVDWILETWRLAWPLYRFCCAVS
ncbi:hypothetical protein ABUL39_06200 [Rhodothermus marinus]|uniref:hypothetical protein n=1 Tax=Rhodothermus marinus TaxID=29549 RepID=UPI000223DD46|nr:hypothetical protein [Rhodothermus marinus]AEN73235.1 hypothetical protein Rhom172_1308 [Rhodothermus marinus SG0.5JP17-172]MBO2491471.1 hypothetical protein [Rhodothermus marinus]